MDSSNKLNSEDNILKSFLEKQENKPFLNPNNNGNINFEEFINSTNTEYKKFVDGKFFLNVFYL